MRKLEDEQSAAQPEVNDDGSFKVFVRVRPLLPREILNGSTFSIVDVKASNKTLLIYEYMNFEAVGVEEIREHLQNPKYYQIHPFNYDFIFNEKSLQEEVYEIAAKKTIDYTIKGYNSTVIAYGQTGTGKTFTMEGSLDSLGIIPQAIHDVFRQISDKNITVSKVYNRVSSLSRFLICKSTMRSLRTSYPRRSKV